MADIAILVAEEYERRLKQTAEEKMSPAMGYRKNSPETAKKMLTFEDVEKKMESFKRKFEAKSQFALAASCGLFSA
ncbi:PREDICTED: uncharacterized protein LOC109116864 [Tarenaya hassleriana]|uniref:uncharacterized protein LOC109116864 n=1 Tax=Tarenaya hassleriana TaxID=28532 RepID=UPI0008FD31B5|nr:PREDICTED: uncharacterized protein LOC109116864 [Tarenaya hassleriana]